MGRKPEPSRRTPSFFKVMFGDFSDQLKIPPAFVKHFDGVLPQKIVLRSPAKRVWFVNVKKVENNLFFEKGWRLFVQDNSLEVGDFLVFRYDGNSKFNVAIYGKTGCEKEVVVATRKSIDVTYIDSDCSSDETGMPSPQDQFISIEFQPLQDNFKQLTREEKTGSRIRQVTQKSSCPRVPTAMRGKARALEAANNFVSKHPFLKIVMTQSYQLKANLNVPSGFVKRYIKGGRQSVMLQVSNRSWPVNLLTYANYEGKFSTGSRAFVKDNTLREGDVCVFELIQRNDIVLNVSIFRCDVA